jgi:hypothetical protein
LTLEAGRLAVEAERDIEVFFGPVAAAAEEVSRAGDGRVEQQLHSVKEKRY